MATDRLHRCQRRQRSGGLWATASVKCPVNLQLQWAHQCRVMFVIQEIGPFKVIMHTLCALVEFSDSPWMQHPQLTLRPGRMHQLPNFEQPERRVIIMSFQLGVYRTGDLRALLEDEDKINHFIRCSEKVSAWQSEDPCLYTRNLVCRE